MKQKPPVFRTLDAYVYKKIAGELRGRLPGHIIVDVDRSKDESGKSVVLLRCKQPGVAKKVLAEILGEEYIEPKIDEKDLPEKRKEWWQRSIQMYLGKDRGNSNEISNSIASYGKRFQSDALQVKRRMFPDGGSSSVSSSSHHVEERGSRDAYIERFQGSDDYTKRFREDSERYAKAFHDDVENIKVRMYGGAIAKAREERAIESYDEEGMAKGEEEVKVIVKSNSRGRRGEWWQRGMGFAGRGKWKEE